MKVHIITPYSLEKNLGLAYNQAIALLPREDWVCLMDYDVMLLTPDAGAILHGYAERYPNNVLTCYTNRVHPFSRQQLLGGTVSEDSDIRNHIKLAEEQKKHLYQATAINRDMSGMLILMSVKHWEGMKFIEDVKCLGVDSDYSRKIRERGEVILRMDGLYIFHLYRMGFEGGIEHKLHLQ